LYEIAEEQTDPRIPTIKQLSIFLPNRVGALLAVTRCLDAFALRICALQIMDAADHAVVRLVVDRPGLAQEALLTEGYAVVESDLVGVALPDTGSDGIRRVLQALLLAELNVHYVYPLITGAMTQPILAVHVEDIESAVAVLSDKGLDIIGQDELA
jgi:hypothetical protein